MNLTEAELYDYMHCPVYYEFKHVKKVPELPRHSLNVLLNRVASSFYLSIMNGKPLRNSELKTKWDTICKENASYMTESKCIEGISLLSKLYLWAENEMIRIADINTPYNLVVKNKIVAVDYRGEMSPIAVTRTDQFQLLVTDFSSKLPDPAIIDMKLKYTLDSYAFLKYYNENIGIRIHNVKYNRDFFSYRSKDDFDRALSTISKIGTAVHHELYYPRENVMCQNCSMKNFCKIWK